MAPCAAKVVDQADRPVRRTGRPRRATARSRRRRAGRPASARRASCGSRRARGPRASGSAGRSCASGICTVRRSSADPPHERARCPAGRVARRAGRGRPPSRRARRRAGRRRRRAGRSWPASAPHSRTAWRDDRLEDRARSSDAERPMTAEHLARRGLLLDRLGEIRVSCSTRGSDVAASSGCLATTCLSGRPVEHTPPNRRGRAACSRRPENAPRRRRARQRSTATTSNWAWSPRRCEARPAVAPRNVLELTFIVDRDDGSRMRAPRQVARIADDRGSWMSARGITRGDPPDQNRSRSPGVWRARDHEQRGVVTQRTMCGREHGVLQTADGGFRIGVS